MFYAETHREYSMGQMEAGLPAYICTPAAERVRP